MDQERQMLLEKRK
jgi:hypothetical protein